jgi:flagellar biosynthesis protein FliQ
MHYDESMVFLVRETLLITLKIAAPILGAGVVIGLTISVIQSVTSIQDQTLTFVPKIVAMVLVGAMLIPWIVAQIVQYAAELLTLVG